MITQREKQATLLSPTKKDYYQIWNELLETASKLSERWDPTNTNESDPGIVLLKMLTAIADKLNYNIDKNTLEAFMPSASQEQSMRKLCQMMGYNMKYYQSATTRVTIAYLGLWKDEINKQDGATTDAEQLPEISFVIPRHTNITDTDKSVNYFTLTDLTISKSNEVGTVEVMQGQIVQCEPNNNYLITLANLDDNNRYYLPETQIAQNGIFIEGGTVFENAVVTEWTQVDNLYAREPNSKTFKFGYDSKIRLPYIQFPDTIAELIGTGLKISYVRTAGIYGNVSANKLNTISANKIQGDDYEVTIDKNTFNVFNANAATNGADKESIDQAYNSYKKTVGTFDTLVTCRDYMNAIYNLTQSAIDTSPLLSNVNVTDIRDDVNKALTICSFDSQGIIYNEVARKESDGTAKKDSINAFDLVIYPFKTTYNNAIIDDTRYNKSFQLDRTASTFSRIRNGININKTIAHKLLQAGNEDIVAIKNYYRLNANITTVRKVNIIQETEILTNIHQALYKAFNMRNLDFGEEIPFDTILSVIKNADTRIRNVALQEPTVITAFLQADGNEYSNVAIAGDADIADDIANYNKIYNKLALRNILAGRIALFDYNTDFTAKWNEAPCETFTATATKPTDKNFAAVDQNGTITYQQPNAALNANGLGQLKKIQGKLQVALTENSLAKPVTLGKNEAIQFSTVNYKTTKTYPAYVNYYLYIPEANAWNAPAQPATFMSLGDFLEKITSWSPTNPTNYRTLNHDTTVTFGNSKTYTLKIDEPDTTREINRQIPCRASDGKFTYDTFAGHNTENKCPCGGDAESNAQYQLYAGDDSIVGYAAFSKLITSLRFTTTVSTVSGDKEQTTTLAGLFRQLPANLTREPGRDIDNSYYKYMPTSKEIATIQPFYEQTGSNCYWVQDLAMGEENNYGRGINAETPTLPKDSQYQLKANDSLFINYTPSGTDEDGNQINKPPVFEIYGEGTVIKPNFNITISNCIQNPKFSKNLGMGLQDAFASAAKFSETQSISFPDNVDGLFSFGARQQVEIRDEMIVEIGNTAAANYNFYWQLEGGATEITFKYLEQQNGYQVYNRFMKAGEYFFFTDKYKTQMAYYGDGSQVKLYCKQATHTGTKTYAKAEDGPSVDTILEEGIRAVPWVSIALSEDTTYFTVTEYRYITLTQGDTLVSLTLAEDRDTLPSILEPKEVASNSSPIYTLKDGEGSQQSLPTTPHGWKVGTRFSVDAGPNKPLVLRADENVADKLIFTYNSGTVTLQSAKGATTPLSVKLNANINSPTGQLDFAEDAQLPKAKCFQQQQLVIKDGSNMPKEVLTEGNKLDIWTQFVLTNAESLDFWANIPANNFGLFAIYVESRGVSGQGPGLGCDTGTIKEFLDDTTPATSNLALTVGKSKLFIIQIPQSTKLTLTNTTAVDYTIIISPLDIVNTETNDYGFDINTIDYKDTTARTPAIPDPAQQLFNDLQELFGAGKDFADQYPYLNSPIESDLAININKFASPPEKLSDARIWHDYNNVNNNFVISQIDTQYLYNKQTNTFNGIVLTRSSKL